VTDEARALQLYRLASSLAEAKGARITVGLVRFKEYRAGFLIARVQPAIGRLDVWSVRNVLSVKHLDGQLHVVRYVPGPWDKEPEKLAGQPAAIGFPT
jgi:hypothetical protein